MNGIEPAVASRRIFLSVLLVGVLALAACDSFQFRKREKGALAGGALGAGLGALVGSQTGNAGAGVAIGSVAGAAAGGLIGHVMDNEDDWVSERDRRLERQGSNLEENKRLLNELRAGGADVRSTSRGIVVNLPEVFFEFDSSGLTSSAKETVRKIAAVLRKAPTRSIAVEGHTDSIGMSSYNQALSERRASAVAAELIHDGVPKGRLRKKGFGETRPMVSNETAEGRQENRRVEVIIENRSR